MSLRRLVKGCDRDTDFRRSSNFRLLATATQVNSIACQLVVWGKGFRLFCPKCGTEAAESAQFCFKCGEPMPGSEAAVESEPVVINGVTWKPGTGKYAGFYGGPGGWVTIKDGKIKRARPDREPPSTGRVVAGVICFVVALVAALQGWSWLMSFAELDATGNPFAGLLAPLLLGAFAVAAGFAAAGFVLVSGKKKL